MVSVIIPVYNRKKTLVRAIESVLGQTYDDLEIIVIDDGSTDGSYNAAKKINDRRIKIIRRSENWGVASARNIGLKNATKKYVAFLDSDDVWMPQKIKKQINVLENSRDSVKVVGSSWEIVHEKKRVKIAERRRSGPTDLRKIMAFAHIPPTPTVLARRSVLVEAGGFDESLPTAEDVDLWIRISKEYKFEHIDDCLVQVYREGGGRLGADVDKFISGHMLLYNKHEELYQKLPAWVRGGFFRRVGKKMISFGRTREGRKYIAKSVRLAPLSVDAYLYLVASSGGRQTYKTFKYVYNKAMKMLRSMTQIQLL